MPTQTGQAPGKVSMSGGWTWAIPQNADNPDVAWEFSKLLNDREHQLKFAIDEVQIPVRKDVIADPAYAAANPSNEFFASLVPITLRGDQGRLEIAAVGGAGRRHAKIAAAPLPLRGASSAIRRQRRRPSRRTCPTSIR